MTDSDPKNAEKVVLDPENEGEGTMFGVKDSTWLAIGAWVFGSLATVGVINNALQGRILHSALSLLAAALLLPPAWKAISSRLSGFEGDQLSTLRGFGIAALIGAAALLQSFQGDEVDPRESVKAARPAILERSPESMSAINREANAIALEILRSWIKACEGEPDMLSTFSSPVRAEYLWSLFKLSGDNSKVRRLLAGEEINVFLSYSDKQLSEADKMNGQEFPRQTFGVNIGYSVKRELNPELSVGSRRWQDNQTGSKDQISFKLGKANGKWYWVHNRGYAGLVAVPFPSSTHNDNFTALDCDGWER